MLGPALITYASLRSSVEMLPVPVGPRQLEEITRVLFRQGFDWVGSSRLEMQKEVQLCELPIVLTVLRRPPEDAGPERWLAIADGATAKPVRWSSSQHHLELLSRELGGLFLLNLKSFSSAFRY